MLEVLTATALLVLAVVFVWKAADVLVTVLLGD